MTEVQSISVSVGRDMGRIMRVAFGLALVTAVAVTQALAQDPATPTGPVLVGTLYDSTSAGPLGGAAVYLVGTPHVTVTDAEGAFALPGLDPGTHTISVRHPRFDSLGVEMPPSWNVEVPGTGVSRIGLAIPSMATLLPNLCILGEDGGRGIAVGRVTDAATGTALPQASVDFTAPGRAPVTAQTDNTGRFLVCGLPHDVPMIASATFFRRAPARETVTYQAGQPRVSDFELELSPGTEVTGRVVDESSGSPVPGAVIHLESADGEVGRVLSDERGGFRFENISLDTYLVSVEHLAYGTQMKWFTVNDVEPLELELAVVPDAIEMEALVVTVRSAEPGRTVDSGVRRDFISRPEIEALLGSARNVGDLVRTIPGVRVQNLRDPVTNQMRLCIEGRRTYQSNCNSVLVVIDGVMSDPEMLEALPPDIIRNIQFVPAVVAGIRYGRRTGSGVLEITTMR